MYLFMVVNCCKTGIEVSKCVYLSCMAVKIEHTVACHNHDILQQCISDDYASQVWGLSQSKTCQIYAFVHRNLFACTDNYIKINFVVFSVIFLFRESSRHKHKCPFSILFYKKENRTRHDTPTIRIKLTPNRLPEI